ncbi:hypothetical protein AHAS_Ahas11G0134400 [Arachis hypogaea]
MNTIECDIVHTLLYVWEDNPLDLRMILVNVQASKNTIVKMAGGIEAIAAMRKKLGTSAIPTNTKGGDRISSSAIYSNLPPLGPRNQPLISRS